jgi:SAM-dependent methyltransferase
MRWDESPSSFSRFAERILVSFCREPSAPDYAGGTVKATVDNSLDFLSRTVPDFHSRFVGKKVLDFGCGWGNQAVAMAKNGAAEVVGIDIQWHDRARRLADEHGCSGHVRFVDHLPPEELGTFDMVLSCSAMEHFADPAAVVAQMQAAVRPGGLVIISFAEPWFGPRGSHFDGFSRLPWVNLLFPESVVMRARSKFRSDGARRYEDVAGGLNRMSLAKFERIIRNSGMTVEYYRAFMTKGLPVGSIPLVRELFGAAAACILRAGLKPHAGLSHAHL